MKNQENDFIFVHSTDTGDLCTVCGKPNPSKIQGSTDCRVRRDRHGRNLEFLPNHQTKHPAVSELMGGGSDSSLLKLMS